MPDKADVQLNRGPNALWATNLSVRAFAICLSVWFFTSCVLVLKVPMFYPLLEEPELRLRDQFFTWRKWLSGVTDTVRMPPTSEVRLVTIDDMSVREIGSFPPWPRVLYSSLVDKLAAGGASVIGFAMVFDTCPVETDSSIGRRTQDLIRTLDPAWKPDSQADDKRLRDSFSRFGKIVLASTADLKGYDEPARYPLETFSAPLGGAGAVGSIVVDADNDGVVRSTPLVSEHPLAAGQLETAFALRVLERRRGTSAVCSNGMVMVRDKRIPSHIDINFAGGESSFASVPLSRVLSGQVGANEFKDKVVLVGFQQYRAPEGEPTPSYLTPVAQTRMSGLEMQAQIVNSLLTSRYISEPSPLELVTVLFLSAMLMAYLFHVFSGHPWASLAGVGFMTLFCLVWSFLCFIYLDFFVPSVVLIIGLALPSMLLVMADQNLLVFKERRKHTRLFHSLMSRAQAQEIDRQKLSALALEGKTMFVTILVCEVRGLRALLAQKSPGDGLRAVDEMLKAMAEHVHASAGMVWRVDSYGLAAVWGAPLAIDESRQIQLVLDCAGAMRERSYSEFNKVAVGTELAWPSPCMRLAVSCGEALCGKIGAEEYGSYGIIGEPVDLAYDYVRVCDQLQVEVLVNERAGQLIQAHHGEVRELDESQLEEQLRTTKVYEYLGQRGRLSGVREESCELYSQAMVAYRQLQFNRAEELLLKALRVWPEDAPALRLLETCRQKMAQPVRRTNGDEKDGAKSVAEKEPMQEAGENFAEAEMADDEKTMIDI